MLAWWTLTLQLHTHFGFWLRARRIRRLAPINQEVAANRPCAIDPCSIILPNAAVPVVSVIIPACGKVEYTLHCLASIAANPPETAIEVLVIDDATPDLSTACLADIPGIRLIVNPRNAGFLRSCNKAARVATGEFLLFLNNDTLVLPGWLDAMLVPFRTRCNVGAVGSKLLYPDGRLQEAGAYLERCIRLELWPAR